MWTVHRLIECLLTTFLLVTPVVASGKESFTVKPPASWVEIAPLPAPAESYSILVDHQTRVGDHSIERYVRSVRHVRSQADLSDAAEIQIEFEPSYQSLTIHNIQIRRGGQVSNALKPGEVRLLHRERELDQQVFNGTVQAVALLSDVRVGDDIDFSYTITGGNPVLGGRYADFVSFASSKPIKRSRFRLLWPRGRNLSIRKHNTDIEPKITPGPEVEYVWEKADVAPIDLEDRVPEWFDPDPIIELSEFKSWSEVVEWWLPLFQAEASNSTELAAQIAAIAKATADPEQRAGMALRFVQDEVRYLGIEMGPYSHQPTLPSKVLARRFGDCKDKALLLTVMLRQLGIDAAPALVSTQSTRSVESKQPGPYAFDHAIVNVRLGEKTRWLDGTATFQRGVVNRIQNPPYAWALVLRPGVAALEEIPAPALSEPAVVQNEKYRIDKYGSPVSLVVTTTYSGDSADNIRYRFSRMQPEEIGKSSLNYYAESNPSILQVGAPKIVDNDVANVIVVTHEYSIPDFWKDSIHEITANRIADQIKKPRVSRRSMPLLVPFPVHVRQTVEVEMPDEPNVSSESKTIKNDFVHFEYSSRRIGKRLVLEYSFKSLRDHVPVKDVQSHLATLDSIDDSIGYGIPGESHQRPQGQDYVWRPVFVVLVVVAIVFGIRKIIESRRQRAFRQKFVAAAGGHPETAIAVSGDEQMLSHLSNQSCRCGTRANPDRQNLSEETVVYDGQRITVFRIHCQNCGADRDIYFKTEPVPTNAR
jgi:transglutaminase-like putative cysteine protease